MRTERDLQVYFTRKCKLYDMLSYKFESPSANGVPDLIVINTHGQTCYVEMKSPAKTGRLSPIQKVQIARIRKQGAKVYVIDNKEDAAGIAAEIAAYTGADRGR